MHVIGVFLSLQKWHNNFRVLRPQKPLHDSRPPRHQDYIVPTGNAMSTSPFKKKGEDKIVPARKQNAFKLYQQIRLHAFLCMTLPSSSITEGPMLSGQQITSSRPIGSGEVTTVLEFSIRPQKLTEGTGEALCILNLDTLNGDEWSASRPQSFQRLG
jgi:hypothetical protein